MNNITFKLNELIQESDFQKFQDEIATATNVSMITVDYSGSPVTKHSGCCTFCDKIRNDKRYKHLCEKCDSRGGLEAARLHQPYVYICHMGLVDFAIPVILNGLYLGAVMGGQIKLPENEEDLLEKITYKNSLDELYDQELLEEYDKIQTINHKRIKALSQLIFYTCNSYIKESLNSNFAWVDYSKYISADNESTSTNKNRQLLAPAVAYIDSNFNNTINLKTVANICQISTSYLSRLFKKVMNTNFASYVNQVRVNNAKKLLLTTNKSINEISIDCGYEDDGYFIKVFKKFESATPNEYRNKYINNKRILRELKSINHKN